MRLLSCFNQGEFEIHGERPFADGACLKLSHEWLLLREVGRRFMGGLLKTEQIKQDQGTYLASADKVLNAKRLSPDDAAHGVSKMTEFALNGWGRGSRYQFDPGLRDFAAFFALGERAHGVVGVYGTTADGARWAHALGIAGGSVLFDANNGEWELDGPKAQDLKIHCDHKVAFMEGDQIFAVHFIVRQA